MFENLRTKIKRKNCDDERKHDKYYSYKKSEFLNNKQIQKIIKKLFSQNMIVNHRDRKEF